MRKHFLLIVAICLVANPARAFLTGQMLMQGPPPAVAPPPPGGAPAPAVAAGFNTVLAQYDLTTVASTWPNSHVVECGAARSTPGVASTYAFSIHAANGIASPCARASIINDTATGPSGSSQTFRFQWLTSDPQSTTGGGASTGGVAWPWPSYGGAYGANVGPWIPNGFYLKMIVRWDSQTLIQSGYGGNDELFSTSSGGSAPPPPTSGTYAGCQPETDENIGETGNSGQNNFTTSNVFQGGYWENLGCSFGNNIFGWTFSGPSNNITINLSAYHTYEILFTNDGSSTSAVCSWLDANGNYNGPGFVGCTSGSLLNPSSVNQHNRMFSLDMGTWYGGGALINDAAEYLQHWEVRTCANFTTTPCNGPVINHWPYP